jgi:hypothetical protein
VKRLRVTADERGAILVIALFFAIFALALLYTVVGTAGTVFFREHMQDAADAAALSGAVAHARTMNLLVLLNIVMAALLAILVTLKLIEALAILGIVLATLLAWPTFGASLSAIPPLKTIQSQVSAAYDTVKPAVDTALEALHSAADAVQMTAPAIAGAIALGSFEGWKPPVESGVAVGSRMTLPVEDDEFKELCGQAGEFPPKLANAALGEPGIGPVFSPLQGPMHSMTEAFSEWFCGDGGTSPPTFQRTAERSYPRLAATVRCEEEEIADPGPVGTVQAVGATTPACTESEHVESEARPDGTTGGCRADTDCSLGGPYEQRVAQARVECAPTGTPAPYGFRYQERKGKVEYLWTGKQWVRGAPRYQTVLLRESEHTPPCGPRASHPLVAEGYNAVVRASDDVNEILPVCTTESLPEPGPSPLAPGALRTVEFLEVSHILGCKKREVLDVSVKDAESSGGGSEKAPKQIAGDAALGDENFQVRALMKGDANAQQAQRIVRLALWGEKAPKTALERLRQIGDFSVAQAEYFYDGAEGRGAYMWNMKWRARLRRFSLPEDGSEGAEALSGACQAVLGEACGAVFELGQGASLFAH